MGLSENTAAVRRFNRFYTGRIGALDEGHLGSELSLTEVRILYELAHAQGMPASALAEQLHLDPGYLSRTLAGFRERGWISSEPHPADARQKLLELTSAGRRTFAPLDAKATADVKAWLGKLSRPEQDRLVGAMAQIRSLLEPRPRGQGYLLRDPKPGELGWVVQRHGELYAAEYGYDRRFEGLVAQVIGEYVKNFDPKRDHAWIAERAGEPVGSVFLVAKTAKIAKLRLLLVEPSGRGLGIGKRLVEECSRFARGAGYERITLWTQEELTAARGIYQAEGYKRVGKEKHKLFGRASTAETWELKL